MSKFITISVPSRPRTAALALMLLFFAPPLAAVDGVIEINQVRALAGGVTPGDTPGFPVILDQPGSYRLTGNLIVDDVETDAIDVLAQNVTLDLNGFSILGPISCTFSEGDLTCTPDSSTSSLGDGVKVRGSNFAIRNGVIRGMGRAGIINFSSNPPPSTVKIENLRVLENGAAGIGFSGTPEVTITGSTIARNKDQGIWISDAGSIRSSTISENGGSGIIVNQSKSALLRDNLIFRNGTHGIFFNGDSIGLVLGNEITENGTTGLRASASSGTAYGQNVFQGNGGTVTGTAVEIATNVCNGNTVCP
ncbi:MAG: right-handed parallel beta-helix repeat-containing protein [Acidobacteriota bacterium]